MKTQIQSAWLPRIATCLLSILRGWWSVDRIRIGPAVGRLLNVHRGDLIQLRDVQFLVRSRSEATHGNGIRIRCQLTNTDSLEASELTIDYCRESMATTATLHASCGAFEVFDEDLVQLTTSSH